MWHLAIWLCCRHIYLLLLSVNPSMGLNKSKLRFLKKMYVEFAQQCNRINDIFFGGITFKESNKTVSFSTFEYSKVIN